VLNVAVHPGGAAFATSSSDARVRLFDLATRACVQTVNDHTDQVWALAFSGDGSRLASGGDDKALNFYSVG
jgi:WD repeat-containing protein 61